VLWCGSVFFASCWWFWPLFPVFFTVLAFVFFLLCCSLLCLWPVVLPSPLFVCFATYGLLALLVLFVFLNKVCLPFKKKLCFAQIHIKIHMSAPYVLFGSFFFIELRKMLTCVLELIWNVYWKICVRVCCWYLKGKIVAETSDIKVVGTKMKNLMFFSSF
jgi:hypothetical protein